jgi:hypothetical protein
MRSLDLEDPRIDAIEISICHSLRPLPGGLQQELPAIETAGISGLALLSDGEIAALVTPTEMISSNRPPQRALVAMLEDLNLGAAEVLPHGVVLGTFEAEQYLCRLSDHDIEVLPLFRGAKPLELAPISKQGMDGLAEGMTRWMLNQVQPDGSTTYKYWPSRARLSSADNTIRQAMATICLGRIAERSADPRARNLADRNLDHLVATYYRDNAPHAVVIEGDKVKLGAIALTALAILESPRRSEYETVLARLVETIDFLQDADGGFRTFYAPVDRNDCQNFYPGETLLFWAHALKAGLPGVTAESYMRAFRYYRAFFRAEPNPAFVPWHTQAHVVVRDVIQDPELDAFVFEMNDWLLSMQQWDTAPYADLLGRFYDPARPHYGKSHASATGVYLEGLIDAFELARIHGDGRRMQGYRLAILRGAANLARLQFRTDEDMFYVRDRIRVEGGIRTEVYDNEIRIDNVQHGLMALHRVLERFDDADYAP